MRMIAITAEHENFPLSEFPTIPITPSKFTEHRLLGMVRAKATVQAFLPSHLPVILFTFSCFPLFSLFFSFFHFHASPSFLRFCSSCPHFTVNVD